MTAITEQHVLDALRGVQDPLARRDLVSLGVVRDVTVCGGAVKFRLDLPAGPGHPGREPLRRAAEAAVRALPGVTSVAVEATGPVASDGRRPAGEASHAPHAAGHGPHDGIPGVKHIVAVASGKGGVGKSTVSANLALALARTGAAVGVMDVDVYGPSIPGILGFNRGPDGRYDVYADPDKKILPPVQYGLKVISLGFFMPEEEAMIARGPILAQAVRQFLNDVRWGELDYLICDLPPGTGDVPLSLAQMVPLTGVVIVATPQDVALRIAAKSITMFEKLRVDVLGLVENMSYFMCPHCGTRSDIFAHGGVRTACGKFKVPFLGEIPLDIEVRIASDSGRPIQVSRPDSPQAKAFEALATAVAGQVAAADARRAAAPPVLAPVTFVKSGAMEV